MSTLHDWTSNKESNPESQHFLSLSGGDTFSTAHKFGFLWVPATPQTAGSGTWYLDGVQTATQSWCAAAPRGLCEF